MVSNTPFGMYPYGPYGFNNMYNPYSPQLMGENSKQTSNEGEGETEKESGSKAFITNGGHGKSTGSSKTDLALSIGIGACVAALGVIFTRHILKPRDISKFVGETKNLAGKVTEEVKTVVPEIEGAKNEYYDIIEQFLNKKSPENIPKKVAEEVKTVIPETEKTTEVAGFERKTGIADFVEKFLDNKSVKQEVKKEINPEVKTGIASILESLKNKKQVVETSKEIIAPSEGTRNLILPHPSHGGVELSSEVVNKQITKTDKKILGLGDITKIKKGGGDINFR